MKLPFSLFLALRYLKPKRTFISIITLVSILGVTLGVTVLILVIAVMTGFDRELRQKVIDFDAHILVTTDDVMKNWRELTARIEKTPEVVAVSPYIQGPVIVEFQNRRLAPMIRGIDPATSDFAPAAPPASPPSVRARSVSSGAWITRFTLATMRSTISARSCCRRS